MSARWRLYTVTRVTAPSHYYLPTHGLSPRQFSVRPWAEDSEGSVRNLPQLLKPPPLSICSAVDAEELIFAILYWENFSFIWLSMKSCQFRFLFDISSWKSFTIHQCKIAQDSRRYNIDRLTSLPNYSLLYRNMHYEKFVFIHPGTTRK